MKALCLKEPWASMIFAGLKSIETRKWNSNFVGDLAIVVSQRYDTSYEASFETVKLATDCILYPRTRGHIIGIVELIVVVPMAKWMDRYAGFPVYEKAHGFFLRNIRKVQPVPCKGQLGIFNIPQDLSSFKVTKKIRGPWDYVQLGHADIAKLK